MEKVCRPLGKIEKNIRIVVWACAQAFLVGTCVYTIVQKEYSSIFTCVVTMFLVTLPYLCAKLMKFEMNTAFFCFCVLYALGPLAGEIYRLYYSTTWWDKLLHSSAGVVFAVFGVYLAERLNGEEKTSLWLRVAFGLFFSIALAGLWEFVEYGIDMLFDGDMQHDTVVKEIHSYLLGDSLGSKGTIEGIGEVLVNGQPLEVGGYIDIGLHDTMGDMMVESFGALALVVSYAIDKGKHPLLYSQENGTNELDGGSGKSTSKNG